MQAVFVLVFLIFAACVVLSPAEPQSRRDRRAARDAANEAEVMDAVIAQQNRERQGW